MRFLESLRGDSSDRGKQNKKHKRRLVVQVISAVALCTKTRAISGEHGSFPDGHWEGRTRAEPKDETIAGRLEAIAFRLEAIASNLCSISMHPQSTSRSCLMQQVFMLVSSLDSGQFPKEETLPNILFWSLKSILSGQLF